MSACLASLGADIDVRSLIAPKFITSTAGSTAIDLRHAAESRGATSKSFVNLDERALVASRTPLILHMRGSSNKSDYNHWVAFLGMEGQRARLFDPPHPIATWSLAEVLANWDGFAIAVSMAPISDEPIYDAQRDLLLAILGVAAISYILRAFASSMDAVRQRATAAMPGKQRAVRIAVQISILLGSATAFAALYHTSSVVGFLKNPTAVAEVSRRFFSPDIDEVSLADVKLATQDRDSLIIDARHDDAYRGGTIPRAVNVPISSSVVERQHALRATQRATKIIVFCQSEQCRYADEIARFLKFNGYNDVSIYRGGFQEWTDHGLETVVASSSEQRK
jgi:rhodanese-related sulfurtransferase